MVPLGLVESGRSWYLVAGLTKYAKIYPLEVLSKVLVREETFERPASFSLEEFWQEWKEEQKKIRGTVVTRLVVSPDVISSLDRQVREDLRQMVESLKSDDSGRCTLDVTFDHFSHARNFILIHGGAVSVVEPEALKRSVIDCARETLGEYGAENQLPPGVP